MDRKALDNYFMVIKDYQWISLYDANELNKEYLITHDNKIREKLILGVQHFIFTTLNGLNIKLDGTIIDTNDVIQFFNEYIIREIDNGIFVNKCTLDDIFNKEFFNNLFKYIIVRDTLSMNDIRNESINDTYDKSETKQLYRDLLNELYDEGLLVTKSMYEKYFFNNECNDTKPKTQDIFFTNAISRGALFKVLRSHPKYKSFRDEVKKI